MGKKSYYKKIRKAAAMMPLINTGHPIGSVIKGSDLIAKGVTEVEGVPVNPLQNYKEKTVTQQPVNHNRKMKALYKSHGVDGVNAYIHAANRYITALKAREEKENSQKPNTNEEVPTD